MSLRFMSAVTVPSQHNVNKSDEPEKILKQLLECVQDCQKKFGGKSELATEFDSCVAGLCLSLEAILFHGLRAKSLHSVDQSSTLKHVSELVANSFSGSHENSSFWPFIKKHLTNHEQERYAVLKHIWSDTGCGRAWLRSTLNEHSLERYIHIILGNPNILNEYYESWAILRDEEKNSMLPNMAGGLGSILFAISIDKPELNSGIPRNNCTVKNKVEPVIEAPTPVSKIYLNKKKRKVARQYISFDEDDSFLSSIPSSSSSTASDISYGENNKSHRNKIKKNLIQIKEEKHLKVSQQTIDKENKMDAYKPPRKLSIETSGSREKFPTKVPEILTPINQTEVGELTPVSVEINEHFDSPNNSDEILEIPTDISAVLTAVEDKNKEELRKKEEKINMLLKENGLLQEQVKKYVSAIKMLKRNDNGEINKTLEGLELEDSPDYEEEAKLFQKKLIQVAEMHAELIDFNTTLQQKLLEKGALADKLRSELEVLGGSMPTYDLDASVNIWIPSAFLTGSGSNSHHVYQIFLRAGNDEWNIYRRYAQFHALHSDLKKIDPLVATFDFPPKKTIGNKGSTLVEDRRKRLQLYLRKILTHWPELASCNSRYLLEQHLSFFKDQHDDQQEKKNMFSPRRQSGSHSSNYSGL